MVFEKKQYSFQHIRIKQICNIIISDIIYWMNEPHLRHSHNRYETDQGFSEEEHQPAVVTQDLESPCTIGSLNITTKIKKSTRRQPKMRLKFISISKPSQKSAQDIITQRQNYNRRSGTKSVQLSKKTLNHDIHSAGFRTLIKSRRTLIGQNLIVPSYAIQDTRAIKAMLSSSGHKIIYQSSKQVNTHGYLRKFLVNKSANQKNFLQHRFNSLLKQRLKQSYVMPKNSPKQQQCNSMIQFGADMQCSNLQLTSCMLKQNNNNQIQQYDVYLRNDTNTHGHQNWFYFSVKNNTHQNKTITINVCNVKRDFRMISKGQRIFMRNVTQHLNKDKKISSSKKQWRLAGKNINIQQNTNPKIARGRIYKLSFTITLQANKKYQVSMLPTYSYSQLLQFTEQMKQNYQNFVQIDLLTYSLSGLAIPILTITDLQVSNQQKSVILVSCRIHPGETVSSYVLQGFIRKILSQADKNHKQLLKSTVFKIVPMLNPDGVIFGNFRTNFLGIDMNRGFYSQDQVLHPQIVSLKELGKKLKSQFGNRFLYFIDLHGHSAQKNIFSYGPNFERNDQNFYASRILPKVLDNYSKYFKFNSCSFVLQEHKLNTARGFFLSYYNVMAYTIESSYALYDDSDTQKLFQVKDWVKFGQDLVQCLDLSINLLKQSKIHTLRDIRKILSKRQQQQLALMKKIKSDLKKQKKQESPKKNKFEQFSDSDGQSQGQDLDEQQRKDMEKKVQQINLPSFILPKVLKPTILYPTVTPKLFQVHEQKDDPSFKLLFTKRNKYNNFRVINNSVDATRFNMEELQKLKPMARNIKLEKKMVP